MTKLFLIGLLAVGGYGGFFGYCRYKAGQKEYALSSQAHELRQKLMQANKHVGPEDIKKAVIGFAQRAGVEVDPASITTTIEPLTEQNVAKLTKIVRRALAMIGNLKNHRTPKYLVGFSASFTARYRIAKVHFNHERYTYFEWVKK